MPRQKRIDEASTIYHALNRGNARQTIFHKPEDYEAFNRVLADGVKKYSVQIFCFTLMPIIGIWFCGQLKMDRWENFCDG